MKKILVIFGLMSIVLLSLAACGPSPQDYVSWEVPIENFMNRNHFSDQIEVPVGNLFYLTLGSNPTTGFQWSEQAQISDPTVLKQINHEYISPESESAAGTPGQEVWTFEVLKEGESTISMEYSRPWEGGEKAEWTYDGPMTLRSR